MAITKIHPIKSTLNLAIDYITDDEKTDEKILVSTHKCHTSTAHTQFLKTRKDNNTRGTVLARHLIQSFLPGETTPKQAHKIGLDLCKKILKDEYEFVIATHVDKGHIHNHIIFNNVNMVTGKCYQSNKRSYHKIRYHSDKLCEKNKLSVIDEFYESYKKKYKTKGKSWYEYDKAKQGNSWKSRLEFDIDRTVKQAKDWDDFLDKMKNLGYEIKQGKHIAFRHKDKLNGDKKPRFTRSKTLGDDYVEQKLKERIIENNEVRTTTNGTKKRIGKVINMEENKKVKDSKGYEIWATKHNLSTMSESIILMREKGFKSMSELDKFIQSSADKRQDLQDKIKVIDKEMDELSATMENIHIINKYREYYKHHKSNPDDTHFNNEYSTELTLYKTAANEILKTYEKLPKSKDILAKLDKLKEKKNTLMDEYSSVKTDMDELYQIHKNYETYMNKTLER